AHERGHLPGEVHDLLARHALRRQLELVEGLLDLDLLDLEVAQEELVPERVLARRLQLLLDLVPIGTDGDVAIRGHDALPQSTYTVRSTWAMVVWFWVTSRIA